MIESLANGSIHQLIGPLNHSIPSPHLLGQLAVSALSSYECHELCECGTNCGNRVSQEGVKLPLEVFDTGSPAGYGLRCRVRLPAGTPLCVYAGVVVPARLSPRARAAQNTQAPVEEPDSGAQPCRASRSAGLARRTERRTGAGANVDSEGKEDKDMECRAVSPVSLKRRPAATARERSPPVRRRHEAQASGTSAAASASSQAEAHHGGRQGQTMTYRLCVREDFGGRTLVTCVDAAERGNEARFCNHSCAPNVAIVPVRRGWVPRLVLVTARDVPALEELCFDYAAADVPGDQPPRLSKTPCCCGAEHCRGFLPAVAE